MSTLGITRRDNFPPVALDMGGGAMSLFGKLRGAVASGREMVYRTPGPDAFGSDVARAWVAEFAARGAPAVEDALEAVLEAALHGHLPRDVAERGIAAAEAVAFAYDRRAELLGEAETEAMGAHAQAVRRLPDIRATASRAMIAVAGKAGGKAITSDLAEIWHGTGNARDGKLFMATVRHLAMRVKG